MRLSSISTDPNECCLKCYACGCFIFEESVGPLDVLCENFKVSVRCETNCTYIKCDLNYNTELMTILLL